MGKSRRLDLSVPYSPTRYSSGYGLRLPPDEVEGELLGGLQQYPAATHTAPPDNADEGWITPQEETPDETKRDKGEGFSPPESQTIELPPTPPAEDILPSVPGQAYIPWVPVRYQEASLNEPKTMSPQELLAGFGRMVVRDAPPHQGGRGEGGWGAPRTAEQGSDAADFPARGREGCFECGEHGHMARECPARASKVGGGIPKFGAGNECRRCRQEGHWAKECPNAGGFDCYNCGQSGHISRDCLEPRKTQGGPMKCYNCHEFGHISRECPGPQGGDAMAEDPREDAATTRDNGWGFKNPETAHDDDGWGSTPAPDSASRRVDTHEDGWTTSSATPNGHNDNPAAAAHASRSPEPVVARAPIGMHPDRARRLGAPVRDEPRATNRFALRDHPSQAAPAPLLQPQSSTTTRPPPSAPTPAEDDEFGGW